MAQADSDDTDGLAAEYVLGTLADDEHAQAAARIAADPAFAAAVASWERRMSPLQEETPAEIPSEKLTQSILERFSGSLTENVTALKRRVSLWRGATLAAGTLAAALLIVILLPQPAPTGTRFVAVLEAKGAAPAFVAAIDTAHDVVAVRRIAAEAGPGHSYELWALGAGRKEPQALGVIDASLRIPTARLGPGGASLQDTTLAVSLEPEGGSPTGLPTGPVLFTGKLVRAD